MFHLTAPIGAKAGAVLTVLVGLALGGGTVAAEDGAVKFREGTLPRSWDVSAKCTEVPDFQVHEYNPTSTSCASRAVAMTRSRSSYLLLGSDKALLLDTGAGSGAAHRAGRCRGSGGRGDPCRWLALNNRASIPLVVAHLHSHGDHTAGDPQFAARRRRPWSRPMWPS